MKTLCVEGLPGDPLEAAGAFNDRWLDAARTLLESGDDLLLVFPPADHTHRAWRRAVVQGLARRHAPARANAITGKAGDAAGIERYFANAPGVTGQYLESAE